MFLNLLDFWRRRKANQGHDRAESGTRERQPRSREDGGTAQPPEMKSPDQDGSGG